MRKTSPKSLSPTGISAPSPALSRYRDKRDPGRTPEPFGTERKSSTAGTRVGRFVVHQHRATRLHYDLRLEVGGTLKSYAVPKGPSLDPKDKRLAIQTEDHPLEYLEFEDVIPEGSYGAGAMIAWDMGRVHFLETTAELGLERGKLDFELSGFKLKGRFALVATGRRKARSSDDKLKAEWLLIKKSDNWATESDVLSENPRSVLSGLSVEELGQKSSLTSVILTRALALGPPERDLVTRGLVPMLCAHSGAELEDPGRLYELKLDGVRILAEKRGGAVLLRYRNGGVATATYPEVTRAVETYPLDSLILDGEIVAFDIHGRPSFERLGGRIHAARPEDVRAAMGEIQVQYLVFDVLRMGPYDLRELPLFQRKELLTLLVRGKGFVRVLDHIESTGTALYEFCQKNRLEGVVAKRRDAVYQPGPQRTSAWVKLKCEREQEFVVMGWLSGKGARQPLGALCVGSYAGPDLVYRGRVGSGLEKQSIARLKEKFAKLEQVSFPGLGAPPQDAKGAVWVTPEIVVGVRYQDWTEEGRLRAPVFLGVREDVSARDCTAAPSNDHAEGGPIAAGSGAAEALPVASPPGLGPLLGRVVVTRPEKVFWPDEGYTKGDLIEYYLTVAPLMLPFLKGRPVVLVRHPDGISGKSFYQWNVPQGTPDWLERFELPAHGENGEHETKTVFLIESSESLAHIANLGCIPIHVLASRKGSVSECDFLTVDFDIGEQPFADAVTLALSLREILEEVGLLGFPKTSGQKGLHVLVPLGRGISFEVAKLLVELLGRIVTGRHSDLATMERRVNLRGPRVLVDIGQTGASRTIVAPYSVRAQVGATVSTPLCWEEIHRALNPARFTLRTVPLRISEIGDLLADFFQVAPNIPQAVSLLERWVRG